MDLYRHQLADGSLTCLLIHVAEGSPTDASAHREFKILKAQGLLRRGVAVIHGVAFRQEDFKDMAANGVSLVWSPRSNYELYGATTRIQEAKGSGVTIALAPDWSPTGSAGMLQELRYVADWNQQNKVFQDSELIEMTTSIPAEIVGFGDEVGTLAPGRQADLLVLKELEQISFCDGPISRACRSRVGCCRRHTDVRRSPANGQVAAKGQPRGTLNLRCGKSAIYG
jgi:5-methylthioadenosine/S-adenosylhomocysteine deaminase